MTALPSSSTQFDQNNQQLNTKTPSWVWWFITIQLTLIVFINLIYIGGTSPSGLVPVLLMFVLGGFFPISFLSYRDRIYKIRKKRLSGDLYMLGYIESAEDEAAQDQRRANVSDPKVKKPESAKSFREEYQTVHSLPSYALFVSLAVIATATALLLFFWIPALDPTPAWFDALIDARTIVSIRYGFFGSYLFAVFLVYRRYTTEDMQPVVYLNSALTMIAGVIFNYVAFEAIIDIAGKAEGGKEDIGLMAILAFALGYFPYLAIRWFGRLSYAALNEPQRRSDALPLSLIDGISEWHESRLRDRGIDNLDNLATVEIRDLLYNTPFDAQQVISWVDQASLLTYLDASEIESFRRGKIRMLSDFHSRWREVKDIEDGLKTFAQQLQTTPERLTLLHDATWQGPNVHRVLNYWAKAQYRVQGLSDEVKDQVKDDLRIFSDDANTVNDYHGLPIERMDLMRELAFQYALLVDKIIDPPSEDVLRRLGVLTLMLRRHTEAFDFFKRAINRNNQAALSYGYRGRAWRYVGQYDKALQDFDESIKREPANWLWHAERANTYLDIASCTDDVAVQDETLKQALAALKEAEQCDQFMIWTQYQIAVAHIRLSALEAARPAARKAIDWSLQLSDAQDVRVVTILVQALIERGNKRIETNPVDAEQFFKEVEVYVKYTEDYWTNMPSGTLYGIAKFHLELARQWKMLADHPLVEACAEYVTAARTHIDNSLKIPLTEDLKKSLQDEVDKFLKDLKPSVIEPIGGSTGGGAAEPMPSGVTANASHNGSEQPEAELLADISI